MSKRRVWMFWVILFAGALSSTEVLSLFALHIAASLRPGAILDLFLERHFSAITLEDVRKFENGFYHPVLGWDYEPSSHYEGVNRAGNPYTMSWGPDGARDDGLIDQQLFVATYGDSFAAGEEVDNDETWQYFLSKQIGKRAANFGTSAYGTDQALMKFQRHLDDHVIAPITILSVFEENINRTINLFRPFYRPEDGLTLGFKPRYSCSGSGVLLLEPNPLHDFKEDIGYLRQLAEDLVDVDAYARRKIRLAFPYSLRLMQLTGEFLRRRFDVESWLVPETLDLWAKPDTAHLMRCIVDHFIHLCRRHHSKPVVLFIPRDGTPTSYGKTPNYHEFVQRLRVRHPDTVIVDVAAQQFEPNRFRVTPTEGHTSRYGNEVIANALRQALGL